MILLAMLTKESGMSYGSLDLLHLRLLICFTTSSWRIGVKYSELGTEGVEKVTYPTGDEIADASFGPTWVKY